MTRQPTTLTRLLDRIGEADRDEGRISLDAILDAVGRRSFGPFILLAGVVTLTPLVGDIPGIPTLMGVLVVLSAGQLLVGRNHVWLPDWLLNRSVPEEKLEKALEWMRKPAGWIDRILRPRLTALVQGAGVYVIATVSLLIALALPPMELVPFSANGGGLALTALGLALIAHDGLMALVALIVMAGTLTLVLMSLM